MKYLRNNDTKVTSMRWDVCVHLKRYGLIWLFTIPQGNILVISIFQISRETHTHTLTSNHAYNFAQLSPIIHHMVHRSHRWISLFINICLLSRFGPGSLATAAPSNIFGFVLFTRESATWDRPPCYLPSLWTVPRLVAKDLFTRTTPSVLPSVQEYKTNYTHTSRNKYRIIIYRWLHCQS